MEKNIKFNTVETDGITLTKKSFVQFINSINYRVWIDAMKNADNVCSAEHFGGIFFLYSQIISQSQIKDSINKEISDSLQINKALYNIASQNHFYSLCDFLTEITREMVISACRDIKGYMLENFSVFGERGLVQICFQKLMMSQENDDFDREYWERCLKEIFELYRMLAD